MMMPPTAPGPLQGPPWANELLELPVSLHALPREDIEDLLRRTVFIQHALLDALRAAPSAAVAVGPDPGAAEPRKAPLAMLSPSEAGEMLGVKPRWVYDHLSEFPGAERLSKKCIRIPRASVEKFLSRKRA